VALRDLLPRAPSRRSTKGTNSYKLDPQEPVRHTPFFSSKQVLETHDQKKTSREHATARHSTTAEHHSKDASRGRPRYSSCHLTTSFCAEEKQISVYSCCTRVQCSTTFCALFLRNTCDSNMISPHLTPHQITPDTYFRIAPITYIGRRLRQIKRTHMSLGLHCTCSGV
jgi:hypothetical protein